MSRTRTPRRSRVDRLRGRVLAALAGACAVTLAPAGCRPKPPQPAGGTAPQRSYPFTEVASQVGIDFRQHTGVDRSTGAINIIESSAGGCGVLDYDRDGWLDVFLVQGYHTMRPDRGNRLFRNRRDGTFEDVTESAGIRGHGYGMGCAVGDYDADGWPDLYVCNFGTNELFQNRGDGTFEEVGEKTGTAVRGVSIHAAFADLDEDGWPDLYVARYVQIGPSSPKLCETNGVLASCDPSLYEAEPDIFLHNGAGKRFQDRTREAGFFRPDGRAMSLTVADLNEDDRLDVFVANDQTPNSLFLARGGGKFDETAPVAGVAYGDQGTAEANMGCDAGDFDGDGLPDLFMGVMQDRMSPLYRNEGGGLFVLATRRAGLAESTAGVVTYGAGFLDADNDGDLDLFQANGHIQSLAEKIDPRLRFAQPRQLLENDGKGRFTDRTDDFGPAFTEPAPGRGAAFGDLDNDGDVDVVVNNLDSPALLLRNEAQRSGNHWLRVRLEGKRPNTLPEGAVVRLKVGNKWLVRHLHTAYSYASANDPRVHFGLGSTAKAGPVEVRWPDGTRQTVAEVQVDRELLVRQK